MLDSRTASITLAGHCLAADISASSLSIVDFNSSACALPAKAACEPGLNVCAVQAAFLVHGPTRTLDAGAAAAGGWSSGAGCARGARHHLRERGGGAT